MAERATSPNSTLPQELLAYAANIWRRYPREFLLLGAPDEDTVPMSLVLLPEPCKEVRERPPPLQTPRGGQREGLGHALLSASPCGETAAIGLAAGCPLAGPKVEAPGDYRRPLLSEIFNSPWVQAGRLEHKARPFPDHSTASPTRSPPSPARSPVSVGSRSSPRGRLSSCTSWSSDASSMAERFGLQHLAHVVTRPPPRRSREVVRVPAMDRAAPVRA